MITIIRSGKLRVLRFRVKEAQGIAQRAMEQRDDALRRLDAAQQKEAQLQERIAVFSHRSTTRKAKIARLQSYIKHLKEEKDKQ